MSEIRYLSVYRYLFKKLLLLYYELIAVFYLFTRQEVMLQIYLKE